MFRALIDLLIMIAVALIARAILTSIMRGLARASGKGFQSAQPQPDPAAGQSSGSGRGQAPPSQAGGELHKDPVCGTYVAASQELRRRVGNQVFYYCSEACREKHALVAR